MQSLRVRRLGRTLQVVGAPPINVVQGVVWQQAGAGSVVQTKRCVKMRALLGQNAVTKAQNTSTQGKYQWLGNKMSATYACAANTCHCNVTTTNANVQSTTNPPTNKKNQMLYACNAMSRNQPQKCKNKYTIKVCPNHCSPPAFLKMYVYMTESFIWNENE